MPERQQRDGQEVLHLAVAQLLDRRVVGRPFDAAVPARLSSAPSRLSSPLASLCLLVVGDEVVEREAVVAGDEVDALLRLALLVAVDLGAAEQPVGQRADRCPARRGRSRGRRRGSGRSTPSSCRRRSCRPGRARRRPTPRRSAWCPPAPGRTRCPTAPAGSAAAGPSHRATGSRPGRSGSRRRASPRPSSGGCRRSSGGRPGDWR